MTTLNTLLAETGWIVADGATDEAALLKQEIEEGLNWVEVSWVDLEFANHPD